MSQENVEIMARGLDAFNRHDVEELVAMSAPEVELVTLRAAVEGTSYRGPDAWATAFRDFDESWEELRTEVERVHSGGNWVLVLAILHGRGLQSGADVAVRLATLTHFRDGLITSFRVYADRDEALRVVGLGE